MIRTGTDAERVGGKRARGAPTAAAAPRAHAAVARATGVVPVRSEVAP